MTENSQFLSGGSHKVENDPWIPLEPSKRADNSTSLANSFGTLLSAPQNPLYQLIDSEKYIQSLEQKLAKLTKSRSKQREPTSRDIISSLAVFHEDQMRRFIDDSVDFCPSSNGTVLNDSSMQGSYLQRKVYPERQPLNPEEIAELLKADVIAEKFEELGVYDNDIQPIEPKVTLSAATVGKSDQTFYETESVSFEQTSEAVSQSNGWGISEESKNWANFGHMNNENERDS